MLKCLTAILILIAGTIPVSAAEAVLTAAHAHNDYHHDRPLLDALEEGFASVEADVFLVDGELLVGHSAGELQPGRTLQKLYLDPLLKRVRQRDGSVFGSGDHFTLLVDIKSEATPTTAALAKVLANYREMLSSEEKGSFTPGAVTIIVSGNRSVTEIAAYKPRLFSFDGRPGDLSQDYSPQLMPLVSASWPTVVDWDGTGEFASSERAKLKRLVASVHAQGMRLRFWATPDKPAVWEQLQQAGVDVIGADDLGALGDFLRNIAKPGSSGK